MNKIHLSELLRSGILFMLTACQALGRPLTNVMSRPGDTIDGMNLTTGVENAAPLWAFCLPTVENDHLISADCPELSYRKLAIGHTFGVMDLLPQSVDWSELIWELYLDGHPIDLNAFGTNDFVLPNLTTSHSPIREVFRKITVWDVVLVNPTLGAHTLRGIVQTEAETYTWIVSFTIKMPPGN